MPSSAKRSQRSRREVRRGANGHTSPDGLEDSSPSRPAKRRKKANSSDHIGPSPDAVNSSSHAPDDELPSSPNDDQLVSQITQQLKTQPIQAAKDHANAIHEANSDGVKAYAKLAALDWTFYITETSVNIGRAPETSHPSSHARAGSNDENDSDFIHIDLGPSKMVSREHAAIRFEEKWFLQVRGRNGAKVDGKHLKPGSSHPLMSGEVIEIGNVEMMFVLPSEISPLLVHSAFLQRAGLTAPTRPSRTSRRQAAIAPAPPEHRRPGTPPSALRRSTAEEKSPAVATPAVIIGPNGVDLSLDDNKHIKPQFSYAQMITQAILNAPDGKLNLNGIYNFIMDSYSYYRHQPSGGWQNSIRHNLSLNKAFDKVARSTDEPGKGMKWQIVPEAKDEMVHNAFRIGRGGHRGSSAPSSPSQLNYITQGPKDMASREPSSARKFPGSPLVSPPSRTSFNYNMPQSTPDRRHERQSARNAMLTSDGSPLPRPKKAPASSASAIFQPQSPTLTSSYLQDDGGSFITPAPPRVHPKLAPPSTAQRPSQHMPTSSPAPFWKYADIGSTPLKPMGPYEISPTKSSGDVPAASSSPPQANKSPPSSPTRHQRPDPQLQSHQLNDDARDFDLTKGFQSIGSYHAPVENGAPFASNAMIGR